MNELTVKNPAPVEPYPQRCIRDKAFRKADDALVINLSKFYNWPDKDHLF